jgi:hypothetical protein
MEPRWNRSALVVSCLAAPRCVALIIGPATGRRISGSTARYRLFGATINASGRQSLTVYSLFQNSRDLLRERSMLSGSPTTQRLFQVVGYICTYENTFPICHLSSGSPFCVSECSLVVRFSLESFNLNLANCEQVYKPNSVLRSQSLRSQISNLRSQT